MAQKSPKIFISYAWKNQDLAKRLQADLQQAGVEVFVDYAKIRGGDSLPARISRALDWCDTLILLWSAAAAASDWVSLEWETAISLKKDIIPCKLDGAELPALLRRLRYETFSEYQQGFTGVCRALGVLDDASGEAPLSPGAKTVTEPLFPLRKTPEKLSVERVAEILKKYDFRCNLFEENEEYCNPNGKGIDHGYELQRDGHVIFDDVTDLMWQQSGSEKRVSYSGAEKYIAGLNVMEFAGYRDWRLPTLDEAMSLVERDRKFNFAIDALFDSNQIWIWTADKFARSSNWFVDFEIGYCGFQHVEKEPGLYVRAVR